MSYDGSEQEQAASNLASFVGGGQSDLEVLPGGFHGEQSPVAVEMAAKHDGSQLKGSAAFCGVSLPPPRFPLKCSSLIHDPPGMKAPCTQGTCGSEGSTPPPLQTSLLEPEQERRD